MTDPTTFAKLVPGFDFLQGLMKNAGTALPAMGQWIAPTLDPEELEKRIEQLKTVQFWLEQNARMLGATIQALEVQRMTLSTLKTMNLPMADLTEALKVRVPPAAAPAAPSAPRRARRGPRASDEAAAPEGRGSIARPGYGRGRRGRRPDAVVGRADQAVRRPRDAGHEGRGRRSPKTPWRPHPRKAAVKKKPARKAGRKSPARPERAGSMSTFLSGHATHPDWRIALALAAAQVQAQAARTTAIAAADR